MGDFGRRDGGGAQKRRPFVCLLFARRLRSVRCRVANPSERKNASSLVKKCPKWGFYYIRTSEKMPDAQKWGIFFMFYCIFINKGKCPMSQKMPIFPKKALKMPGWQHWCAAPLRFLPAQLRISFPGPPPPPPGDCNGSPILQEDRQERQNDEDKGENKCNESIKKNNSQLKLQCILLHTFMVKPQKRQRGIGSRRKRTSEWQLFVSQVQVSCFRTRKSKQTDRHHFCA